MEKLLFADTFKKNIQSILRVPKVVIDDPIFRLHYRATGLAFFFASLLVSGYQFFGKPILCIQRDDIPKDLLNTYCWIEGTFTLLKALNKKVGEEIVYPGVETYKVGDGVIEHSYYQWVFIVLFLQGLLFCTPYFIWHYLEGGKMKNVIQKVRYPVFLREDREEMEKEGISKNQRYEDLAKYFWARQSEHNNYSLKFLFCEALNFINVVGQIFFLDRFLGGSFTTYGSDVVKYVNEEQENRIDPMIKVFPRITKCTFHKYGSSGDVQRHDALCLLPLNIINEKVFVIMWFWLVILAIMGGLLLLYRLVIIVSPTARKRLLYYVSSLPALREDVKYLIPYFSYGDWFVMYLLADNIDNLHFRQFVLELIKDKRFFTKKKSTILSKIRGIRGSSGAEKSKDEEAGETKAILLSREVSV